MPIPKPSGSNEDAYISRCMKVLVQEGKPQDQAYAICKSAWDNRFKNQNTIRVELIKIKK